MIYNGLEFGAFFEIPFTSPCYQILRGVNPVLQMIFTFMQMYFIFMNSRVNYYFIFITCFMSINFLIVTFICINSFEKQEWTYNFFVYRNVSLIISLSVIFSDEDTSKVLIIRKHTNKEYYIIWLFLESGCILLI